MSTKSWCRVGLFGLLIGGLVMPLAWLAKEDAGGTATGSTAEAQITSTARARPTSKRPPPSLKRRRPPCLRMPWQIRLHTCPCNRYRRNSTTRRSIGTSI